MEHESPIMANKAETKFHAQKRGGKIMFSDE